MAKLIDITDMSDAELDALLGVFESELTVACTVRAPGPKRVITVTDYSDGSTVVVTKTHADGYETVVRYASGDEPADIKAMMWRKRKELSRLAAAALSDADR